MAHPDKAKIIDLVSQLLGRSGLSIDQVVARMQINGCDISRSSFENHFTTRIDRTPNVAPEWVLALIAAFTQNLTRSERCAAAEAIELARLARLPIDTFKTLGDLFPQAEFCEAYAHYNPLAPIPPGSAIYDNQPVDVPCPYLGLHPFSEENADFFFGRDAEIRWLLEALEYSRFLAVVGPSGSGKSSLVRAGLIPLLRQNKQRLIRLIEPGDQPLDALAKILPHDPDTVKECLTQEQGLGHLAQELLDRQPGKTQLVLVVDQFEELFTLCQDEAARHAFIRNLLNGGSAANGHIATVVALRADFYGQAAAYPDLAAYLTRHQMLLSPLSRLQLQQAITGPAAVNGLQFEPGLVDQLLLDAAEEPGALPLLQHALLELWERRQGRRLALTAYRAIGGMHGALARRADSILAQLTPAQQDLARRALLRLTRLGEGTPDTRRRVTLAELIRDQTEEADVRTVVTRLADARLVITSLQAETGAETVDLAHEALIRAWPALKRWIAEDREALRVQQQLGEAAREWDQYGRDASYLYQGARLAQAEEWAAAHQGHLNELEHSFLQAGIARREEAWQAAQRTRRWVMAGLATALVILSGSSLISVIFGRMAVQQRGETEVQRNLAEARAVAAEARGLLELNPPLAALLALAAQTIAETDEATQVIARVPYHYPPLDATLAGHLGGVTRVAFSPDGRYLASAGTDSRVVLWNLAHRQPVFTLDGQPGEMTGLRFSPGGQQLAAVHQSGLVTFWNLNEMQSLSEFKLDIGPISSMDYSPDGRRLALGSDSRVVILDAAGERSSMIQTLWFAAASVAYSPDGKLLALGLPDGDVFLWETASGRVRTTLNGHTNTVSEVKFSPDGRYLASSSWDSTVIVWDVTGELPVTTLTHPNQVYSLAFSPDGRRLVTGGYGGSLMVWDVASGRVISSLRAHTDHTWSVAFSPDGRLASGAADQTVMLWDVAGQQTVLEFRGHAGPVSSLAFSTDGRRLASGSNDRTVMVWDVPGRQALNTLKGHAHEVTDVSFSPDGKKLVSLAVEDKAIVWNVEDGRSILSPKVAPGQVRSVAYSPTGRQVASGLADGKIILWDADSGQTITTLEGPAAAVTALAFSPDGQGLASGTDSGAVIAWNLQREQRLAFFTKAEHAAQVTSLAFSPDGQRLASASADKTIFIWDVAGGQVLTRLEGHSGTVWSLAFSPDGRRLVSGSSDNTITVWDGKDYHIITRLNGHSGVPWQIAFSPDGHWLASGSEDQRVLMLDTRFTHTPCDWLTRNLSRQEWQEHLPPFLPYRELCPGKPIPGG